MHPTILHPGAEPEPDDDTATAHEEDSAELDEVRLALDAAGSPATRDDNDEPLTPSDRVREIAAQLTTARAEIDRLRESLKETRRDRDAALREVERLVHARPAADYTAAVNLAAVVAVLDEARAPTVSDTHRLTPSGRLAAYLDQRAEERRHAAEDAADAAEVERGLVLALAAMGHAWGRRAG